MSTLLVLLMALPGGAQDGPPKPWSVPGLTLSEPQVRTKPGFCKVTAKATGTKVKIKWRVRAQFEDSDVEFDYEVRDGGTSVQVVIPDSRGVIEVAALAVIDGEPTDFCETTVTVDYKPRQPKEPPPVATARPPAKDGQKPEAAQGRAAVRYVFFVQAGPEEPDPDVKALVNSVRLKNELKKLGVTPELVVADSDSYRKRGLADAVKRAGGAPCVVYVTEDWLVRKYAKLTAQTKPEDVLKEAGG